jgi:CheY-like chemotaxis protein
MSQSQSRIVVVDDDDDVRSVLCALAHEAVPCATIDQHRSALNALHEVETGLADLLITNCHMPDLDGPTLVQTIRGMKNAIPIIMVSASADARELGEKAGIDWFVEKNRLSAELGDAIHMCLETH